MSSIPAHGADLHDHGQAHQGLSSVVSSDALVHENITLDPRNVNKISIPFFGVALLGLALTIAGALTMENGLKHAMTAYHIGFSAVLGLTLGSLFWVMIMYLVNANWFGPLRRQFENVFSMIGVCALLFIPILFIELINSGVLFKWLDPEIVAGDVIYEHKSAYLNAAFFVVRAVIYFAVWGFLAYRFGNSSLEQDRTGDKQITRKNRFTAGWGMLAFALTTAFAGFDWLMGLDFHFFSTMWGVYFFSGGVFAALAMNAVIIGLARAHGRLTNVVNDDHSHDLGKLMFGFTAFWAYIAFSQYFLIWYSNIPEETAYFLFRQVEWTLLTYVLVLGHFVLPFLILLPRPAKRNYKLLTAMGFFLLLMHVLDMVWIVRPMAYLKTDAVDPGVSAIWLDIAGIAGVICLYTGFLIRRIYSVPLVAYNDPRLARGIAHKNYV